MKIGSTFLLFGATGQDGSIAAEMIYDRWIKDQAGCDRLILASRRSSKKKMKERTSHLVWTDENVEQATFDLTDDRSIESLIRKTKPDVVINFADQDHVESSLSCPSSQIDVTVRGPLTMLRALCDLGPHDRCYRPVFLQPLSTTMFGEYCEDSSHMRTPRTPYAMAKTMLEIGLSAVLREYGVNGKENNNWPIVLAPIMGNHHSDRRGDGYLFDNLHRRINRSDRKEVNLGRDKWVGVGDACQYVDHLLTVVEKYLSYKDSMSVVQWVVCQNKLGSLRISDVANSLNARDVSLVFDQDERLVHVGGNPNIESISKLLSDDDTKKFWKMVNTPYDYMKLFPQAPKESS